jgi:PAS domain S-box-containing protein
LVGGLDNQQDALPRAAAPLTPRTGAAKVGMLSRLWPKSLTSLSLRVALALLVFSVMLPTAVFFAIQYRVAIGEKQNDVRAQGSALARDIADDINYELAIKQAMLTSLATSKPLREGNFREFYEQCKAVEQTSIGWIALYRVDGTQIFSTRAPFGATENVSQESDFIRKVARSGQPEATDLLVSPVGGAHVVTLFSPVRDTDFVLGGSIPSERLSRGLAKIVSDGWLATIIDRRGFVLARSRNAEQVVGRAASTDFFQKVTSTSDGWTISKPLDGNESFTAWHGLPNGWTAIVSVDRAMVEAPLVAWQTDLLRGLVLFSLLAIVLALIVANWIISSIRKLETAAAGIGAMHAAGPISTALTEINSLGEILHRASLERRRGEIANAHLAALVSSSGDAIKSIDLDGRVLTWNAGAEELYGYSADEIIGKPLAVIVPEENLNDLDKKISAAREGKAIRFETKRRHKDGRIIEVSLNAAPIRDGTGNVIAVSTIAHDITQRKRDEAHMQFIMRELSHRSKNLLSIVLSFARQTWNQSKDFRDFEARFAGRLHALARSHDLLVRQDWRGAGLDVLVQTHLAPFAGDEPSRVDASGPDLFLRPDAVQNLGYAFHELATNAAKYGALSQPEGRVTLRWTLVPSADGTRIRLSWRESGGPPVVQPERKGLGSMLIGTMTERALGAKVAIHYEPSGFSWEIDMPADRVLREDLSTPEMALFESR